MSSATLTPSSTTGKATRCGARRRDAARADPLESLTGRRHHGVARRTGTRAWHRDAGERRRPPLPAGARDTVPRAAARARRRISGAYAHPAQDRAAVLHRQAAQQLPARRLHPPDAAECPHHRCASPPARLLLLGVQAALRARSELLLRSRGAGRLLPPLRRADGALRCGAARARAPRLLRADGAEHRARGAPAAAVLRPALRARLPAFLRD